MKLCEYIDGTADVVCWKSGDTLLACDGRHECGMSQTCLGNNPEKAD